MRWMVSRVLHAETSGYLIFTYCISLEWRFLYSIHSRAQSGVETSLLSWADATQRLPVVAGIAAEPRRLSHP
jgi:hypothetical protein